MDFIYYRANSEDSYGYCQEIYHLFWLPSSRTTFYVCGIPNPKIIWFILQGILQELKVSDTYFPFLFCSWATDMCPRLYQSDAARCTAQLHQQLEVVVSSDTEGSDFISTSILKHASMYFLFCGLVLSLYISPLQQIL